MNNTNTPARDIGVGQWISHDLMPGFSMEVREVRPCEPEGTRPEEHFAYRVTDPEGETTWLCGYMVSAVRHG